MQDAGHHSTLTRRRLRKRESSVRVGPLSGIVTLTRELGVNPDEIFEPFGLSTVQFDDPDFEIPYVTVGRLLARCAKATKCPHFGLLVGIRAHPSSLGLPGFLLRSAPDVGTALRALLQNLDLHDQGGVPTLDIKGNSTLLGYAIHQVQVEATEHIYDVAIAIGCSIMRGLCGAGWNPTEVLFSRRPSADLRPYKKFYRAALRFDMDRNAIVFPCRWMNHKIPTADAMLHRHLEQEANELHMLRQQNIISDTRRLLRTSMMSGHCTIHDIAGQLCIHERTLHRRLREEDTSFQLELDAVRYDIACQLLAGSAMPLASIAETLCYSGVSAFNRAFKRWTGFTPARWRAIKTASS
ncbi:MAG: AraC family transcriptional regulator [Gammaproteobacteria bacterium]